MVHATNQLLTEVRNRHLTTKRLFASVALDLRRKGRPRGRTIVSSRGLNLIEIMIVVAIIAMVAGGVAVAAVGAANRAKLKTAKTAALTVREAAQTYRLSENTSVCPSVDQLISLNYLDDAKNTEDPWGKDYLIRCEEERIFVTSLGPDSIPSGDDIRVPEAKPRDGDSP